MICLSAVNCVGGNLADDFAEFDHGLARGLGHDAADRHAPGSIGNIGSHLFAAASISSRRPAPTLRFGAAIARSKAMRSWAFAIRRRYAEMSLISARYWNFLPTERV